MILILMALVFLDSCRKEEDVFLATMDSSYYPIKIGDSAVYKYEVTRWIGFSQTITDSLYWYKEVIDSYYLNENKDTIFRIECYTKPTLNTDWILKKVNQLKRTKTRVFKTEDNITHEIVNYPIFLNKTWNANIMIDSAQYYETHYMDEVIQDLSTIYSGVKDVNSKIINYSTSYTIENTVYPETYTVILHDWTSVIDNDNEMEVYAKKFGLIYKKQYHLVKKYNTTLGIYEPWNGYLKEWKRQ